MRIGMRARLVRCLRRGLRGLAATLPFALAASPAFATTITSGHYTADDSVSYSFTDISSTGTKVLSNTDDTSSTQNIGFTFKFYGTNYTSVSVSSNGILTFNGVTNNQFANNNFNTSATTGNGPTIAAFYDDLDFRTSNDASADGVYVQTIGTTVGSRTFIVQWNKAAHYPQTGVTFSGEITYEVVLYEGSNNFLFSYQDATWSGASGFDYGASATVGIRDTSGQTNGRRLQWSFNSGVLANNYAILFTAPEPGTFALFGAGAAGLAAAVRSRRKKRGASGDGDSRTA
jgi:hypothetical protein